ncbi:Crp/Fnr family transcriptional regulator [Sphingobacterium bambusae]|uniref:Crp/Fnr family transcriptional regulator n=1 Tax=Sphingobacterium bambusae TaxID=662858 RepID=A0ABW6BID9_9SPHI|nr:Crp/Fnr family transcriptional regulator [Sphingobacterium bambusae]WPL50963.1 Crp/Fnr family transcriptional regulator [Sphingobacterium bambusae]
MDIVNALYQHIEREHLWEKSISLRRDAFLSVAGVVETNLFYICSGSLKISVIDERDEHIIRFGYRDNFIMALDSFISEKPSEFYIQAIKKTELKIISKQNYLRFIHADDERKTLWDIALQQLLLQQLDREIDLLTISPKERYLRVLRRSPQLFQEIPNKYIASYLRMSPETLSRLKKY